MCIKRYKSSAWGQVGAGCRSSKCQLEAIQFPAAVFLMAGQTLEPFTISTVHICIDTVTSGYIDRPLVPFTFIMAFIYRAVYVWLR